jgi:hypothetical protein
MKKLLIITLLFSHFSSFAFDDGSDKIIKKYLKAIGGAKEWEAVKTLQIVRHEEDKSWSKSHLFNKISILRDKGYRQEVIIGTGSPTIIGFYEDKGWIASNMFMTSSITGNYKLDSIMQTKLKINKQDQIRDLGDDDTYNSVYRPNFLKWQVQMLWNFLDYEAKEYKINYKGDSKISIDDVSEMEMISNTGDTSHYFFDKKTALLLRAIHKNTQLDLSNYKQLDKVKIAYKLVETVTDFKFPHAEVITPHATTYTIDQVKLNEPMDEKIFMKPKQ